jgi:hypothetical protein
LQPAPPDPLPAPAFLWRLGQCLRRVQSSERTGPWWRANATCPANAIDESKPAKGYCDNCLRIITERDRSLTTFLLPDEY